MTFNLADWTDRELGIERAEEHIAVFRKSKEDRSQLALAIWHIWRFTEYAVNAGLEIAGLNAERGHQLDKGITKLTELGVLAGDYVAPLRQLESFRKKADYGSYSREKSVHYNAANVETLVQMVRALKAELEPALRSKGKLP